jgi:hypothetical protein
MIPVNTRSPYLSDLEVALGQRDALAKALMQIEQISDLAATGNLLDALNAMSGIRNIVKSHNASCGMTVVTKENERCR